MQTILTGVLTASLEKQREGIASVLFTMQEEDLRFQKLDTCLRSADSHIAMAKHQDKALALAIEALKHIAEADTTPHDFENLARTPGESASFTLWSLAQWGFIDTKDLERMRHAIHR